MTCIYNGTINGINYSVLGESWGTRAAWGHNAYLLRNGEEISRARVHYYNRTWEEYQYQSAGCEAVQNAMDELAGRLLDAYRERTGRKRLSADLKKGILEASAKYQELKQVYAAL